MSYGTPRNSSIDYNDQPKEESTVGHDDPYSGVYRMYRRAGQRSGSSRSNLIYNDYYQTENRLQRKDYIGRRSRTRRLSSTLNYYSDSIMNDRDLFKMEYGY